MFMRSAWKITSSMKALNVGNALWPSNLWSFCTLLEFIFTRNAKVYKVCKISKPIFSAFYQTLQFY
jgi:hypothetical protein